MKRLPDEGRPTSAVHGEWGEDTAVERLRHEGYEILERNARPLPRNQRLEIDVIAFDKDSDAIVFVEVKQHSRHFAGESRLRSINARKKRNLRLACNVWRVRNRWHGSYRFDVIEIYGTPGSKPPEVDHIRHVNLFVPEERFARWE